MRRKQSSLHSVQAQLKTVSVWRRSDGIGAGNGLAVHIFFDREPLSRDEQKRVAVRNLEDEMPDLRRDLARLEQSGLHTFSIARRAAPRY